jgi:hypothetical protein
MAQAPWKPVKRWKKWVGQGRIVKTAEEMKAEIKAELEAQEAARKAQEEEQAAEEAEGRSAGS